MPLMDEFREEREAIKNGSFEVKIKYFWSYYKWHTIVAISCVIIAIILIHDVLTQKETAFYAALLNSMDISEETGFDQDFADYVGIDTNEYDVYFDTSIIIDENNMDESSLASSQKLLVYTASSELDVIIGGSDIFSDYAHGDMFCDLRTVLSADQIAKYEPYFYYVDRTTIEALDVAYTNENMGSIPEITIPDPSKPEEMEEPIPIGIFVSDSTKLTDNYRFTGDHVVVGIIGNAPHVETSLKFIEYLFE